MTCDDSGVFGTMTGIIGSMQGQEVLKLITGVGEPLINSLIYYDGLHNRFSRFEVRPSAKNSSLIPDHMIHTDDSDKGRAMDMPVELNPEVLHLYINSDEVTLLDIRDDYKRHTPVPFRHLHLPAADVTDRLQEITGKTVIVFCERGIQSLKVASRLKEIIGNDIQIYSLKHGISYWNRHFGGARITGT
jgi:adenylyltransferase/sulfurtransferase